MKKGLIIVAALGLLAVVSCSKDRTCSCTTTTTSGGNSTTSTADTILADMSKSDAKAACDGFDSTGDVFGVQWESECELK